MPQLTTSLSEVDKKSVCGSRQIIDSSWWIVREMRQDGRAKPVNVAVPKEVRGGKRRVALVPDIVDRLVKNGFEVRVGAGAGENSHSPDEAYKKAGARIVTDAVILWGEADLLLKGRLDQPTAIPCR